MNKILTTREGVTMKMDQKALSHMADQDAEIADLRARLLTEQIDNDHLRVEGQVKDAQIAALMNSQKVDYSV